MLLASALAGDSLAQVVTYTGAGALFKVFGGTVPDSCEDSPSPSSLLSRIVLPSPWVGSDGAQLGRWVESVSEGTGVGTFFRIYKADETTCVLQGIVGPPELYVDSPDFETGEDFAVTQFKLIDYGGGSFSVHAHGQSLTRRLVREMVRQCTDTTKALLIYNDLLRDLKIARDIPVLRNSVGYLFHEGNNVALTCENGVPLLQEGVYG